VAYQAAGEDPARRLCAALVAVAVRVFGLLACARVTVTSLSFVAGGLTLLVGKSGLRDLGGCARRQSALVKQAGLLARCLVMFLPFPACVVDRNGFARCLANATLPRNASPFPTTAPLARLGRAGSGRVRNIRRDRPDHIRRGETVCAHDR